MHAYKEIIIIISFGYYYYFFQSSGVNYNFNQGEN